MPAVVLYDHVGSVCSQMARLALVEKGVQFTRRSVDIMQTAEQFEPWYVTLNPRAVVPTLRLDDEIVCDTIRIVNRIDAQFDGPELRACDPSLVQEWLEEIMSVHYGVLLYCDQLDENRSAPTIVERGRQLRRLRELHPEHAQLLDRRLEGNARLQAILKDADRVEEHVDSARDLVEQMNSALQGRKYLAGPAFSLADCFAVAALARFQLHGFAHWWEHGENANVADYYERMKARESFHQAEILDGSAVDGTQRQGEFSDGQPLRRA